MKRREFVYQLKLLMIQKNRNIYFVVTSRDLSKISKKFYKKIDKI